MKDKKPKILIIYTGGTIGMFKDYQTNALKPFNFSKLEKYIPELKQINCCISNWSFKTPIDSSNITPADWVLLLESIERNYSEYDGFVVLHGTDTMSYSASAISFMIENLKKPIIFTGSQLPIGDLRTDAKENLITAIGIAALQENGQPVVAEVGLYFEYKLFRANRTTKISSSHFNAFSSPSFPCLIESGVALEINRSSLRLADPTKPTIFSNKFNDSILLIKLFPGIRKEVLASQLKTEGIKAVLFESFGAGNGPMFDWFKKIIVELIESGIHIINITQCFAGGVLPGHYETSLSRIHPNIINGKDLTTESALTKLMYLLGQDLDPVRFKEVYEQEIRGEMS